MMGMRDQGVKPEFSLLLMFVYNVAQSHTVEWEIQKMVFDVMGLYVTDTYRYRKSLVTIWKDKGL